MAALKVGKKNKIKPGYNKGAVVGVSKFKEESNYVILSPPKMVWWTVGRCLKSCWVLASVWQVPVCSFYMQNHVASRVFRGLKISKSNWYLKLNSFLCSASTFYCHCSSWERRRVNEREREAACRQWATQTETNTVM